MNASQFVSQIEDANRRYQHCMDGLDYAKRMSQMKGADKDYWNNSINRWKAKANNIARENPMIKKGMIK